MSVSSGAFVYVCGILAGWATRDLVNKGIRWAWRRSGLRCRLQACPGHISQTEHGMGWVCNDCGCIKHWQSWDTIWRKREDIFHDRD